MLESLFNNVSDLYACNFIKKRPQHICFPVSIEKFVRTPILKNICERLLLLNVVNKLDISWKIYIYFLTLYFIKNFYPKSYDCIVLWVVINRALTHTHPHSPTPIHSQPQKGHTNPNPPKPSQKKVTITDIYPHPAEKQVTPSHTYLHATIKKVILTHTHPHPVKKVIPTHIHPHSDKKKVRLTHTRPYPAKKMSCPPKSSRKSMEKKIFHNPLVNQIYQNLKKS